MSGTTRLMQFARQLIVLEKSLESLRGSQLPEGFFQRGLSIGSDFRWERTGRGRPAGRNESPGFPRDTSYLERNAQPSAYCNPQQQLERKIGCINDLIARQGRILAFCRSAPFMLGHRYRRIGTWSRFLVPGENSALQVIVVSASLLMRRHIESQGID